MNAPIFQKATQAQAKGRISLSGPAGAGKTWTALELARGLGARIAVIDTEHGSAAKYADVFDFDTLRLDDTHPTRYVEAIRAAEQAGYDVVVIDSASHEWIGVNGCLALVDLEGRRKGGNNWAAWAVITPLHNSFIEAIHRADLHVIATFRSKMDYIQTKDKTGATVIQKVGMNPISRDGSEYEFDFLGELDLTHTMTITKSRCHALADRVIPNPGADLAAQLSTWLGQGVAPIVQPAQPPMETPAPVRVATPPPDPPARAQADFLKPPTNWTEHDRVMGRLAPPPATAAPDDPDLPAALAAHFDAQPLLERVVPVRFPYSKRGLEQLLAAAERELDLPAAEVERVLGCAVSAYAQRQDWHGRADCLDRVWRVLQTAREAERVPANGAGE